MNAHNQVAPISQLETKATAEVALRTSRAADVPQRARLTAETVAYQGKYQSLDAARTYDAGYEQRRSRITIREKEILHAFLKRYGTVSTILDAPCGGGRLSTAIADHAKSIVEMDIAIGQLLLGRESRLDAAHQSWIRASALDIPLGNASVDGVVCIRLSHHLYSPQERERLLTELLRVARHFVVFHYVDGRSPRYLLRALRIRLSAGRRRRNWMTRDEIRAVVQRHGARIIADVPARPLQPHRYVLIERSG